MESLFIREVTIDWEQIPVRSYLRSIPALRSLTTLVLHKPVTYFVGENGSGKSTLLEAIAVAYGFNPEGGTWNYNFSSYDSHSELSEAMHLTKGVERPKWGYFLRAESFYNVATAEEEYAKYGPTPSAEYHKMSHGESFLKMAQQNFQPKGLYLLDEPEAALSPQRQLTLLAEMMELAREGSQFLVATHSPILLGVPEGEILSFDGEAIHPIPYEEVPSVQVTKMFLQDRERMVRMLSEEE